ncbi:jg17954 [Pararge aegeria aegeria]|uniref:Jg17954 protein n=1 Tax=Pararge aegeria aegeria TaxID=348720 RepID=A0A8S4S523_9NEOP|nr:jg17954 [Pararge aegeria aegeria]
MVVRPSVLVGHLQRPAHGAPRCTHVPLEHEPSICGVLPHTIGARWMYATPLWTYHIVAPVIAATHSRLDRAAATLIGHGTTDQTVQPSDPPVDAGGVATTEEGHRLSYPRSLQGLRGRLRDRVSLL